MDEWDLTRSTSTGMAQTVKMLYIYDATSLTDSDLALEFSRWATDDKAKAGSASLGECEIFPYLDGSMLADDEVFAEAAAQGQSFFASTATPAPSARQRWGERRACGAPMVNYPAASQVRDGCGRHHLLTNSNGTYDTEIAWYAVAAASASLNTRRTGRRRLPVPSSSSGDEGIPDIAMDADPYSGANVYVDGSSREAVGRHQPLVAARAGRVGAAYFRQSQAGLRATSLLRSV